MTELAAILWDVDGTLAETERDGHRVAFNLAFEKLALPWRWSIERYGEREWSPNVIRRLEEATGARVIASGFPAEMVDDEPEEPGYEVTPRAAVAISNRPSKASWND